MEIAGTTKFSSAREFLRAPLRLLEETADPRELSTC
jgi:hypothetical protein